MMLHKHQEGRKRFITHRRCLSGESRAGLPDRSKMAYKRTRKGDWLSVFKVVRGRAGVQFPTCSQGLAWIELLSHNLDLGTKGGSTWASWSTCPKVGQKEGEGKGRLKSYQHISLGRLLIINSSMSTWRQFPRFLGNLNLALVLTWVNQWLLDV